MMSLNDDQVLIHIIDNVHAIYYELSYFVLNALNFTKNILTKTFMEKKFFDNFSLKPSVRYSGFIFGTKPTNLSRGEKLNFFSIRPSAPIYKQHSLLDLNHGISLIGV